MTASSEYYAVAYYKSEQVAQAGPFTDRSLAERAAASYAERGWSVDIDIDQPAPKKISLEKKK
jgi:hypothetical protein